jgi:hypothetical protein
MHYAAAASVLLAAALSLSMPALAQHAAKQYPLDAGLVSSGSSRMLRNETDGGQVTMRYSGTEHQSATSQRLSGRPRKRT